MPVPATESSQPAQADATSSSPTVALTTPAPKDPEPPGMADSMLSTTMALGFVLALAYLALWCLKRLQAGQTGAGRGADDRPRVLQTVPLGRAERLVTVRYRGREYLLGVAERTVNLIDTFPISDAPSPDSTPSAVSSLLSPPASTSAPF